MRWADFSAGRPSAAALRAAGFDGAIRYVGLGSAGKRLTSPELRDLLAAGMGLALVVELDVNDGWGTDLDDDYARGVAFARAGLAEADELGVPGWVPMACAADSHALAWQLDDVQRFAAGFASVVTAAGRASGVYGFSETMQATKDVPGVSWWWQCGAPPDRTGTRWVDVWQRNDGTVRVAGVECDINEVFRAPGVVPVRPITFTRMDEETTMLVPAGRNEHVVIPCNGARALFVASAFGHTVQVHQAVPVRDTPAGPGAAFAPDPWPQDGVFEPDRPGPIGLPENVRAIVLRYDADHAFTAWCTNP